MQQEPETCVSSVSEMPLCRLKEQSTYKCLHQVLVSLTLKRKWEN